MTKRIAVATVKSHLAEVLREVAETGRPVVIERRGQPVAVLRRYDPSDEETEAHWSQAVEGIAAELPDFERLTREAIATRKRARPRRVDLGG